MLTSSVAHHDESRLDVYKDYDFAGCVRTIKRMSGLWIEVTSGERSFPIDWQSKRQSSVARSTTEADMVALANSLLGEVYNLPSFLKQFIRKESEVKFHKDNSAVLQVQKVGYSARLRHSGRVASMRSMQHRCPKLLKISGCQQNMAPLQQKANGFTKIAPPMNSQ